MDKRLIAPGNKPVDIFDLVGLFVIRTSILWASRAEVIGMIAHGGPKIKEVLPLSIDLELGAMVRTCVQTGHLPVRCRI